MSTKARTKRKEKLIKDERVHSVKEKPHRRKRVFAVEEDCIYLSVC